jgi:glycosyltransferase involved in cell wall biosynthesis
MFANRYLQKQNKIALIEQPPDADLGIIIVIPCFREPHILQTLESLIECDSPRQKIEVIVLINHSEIASDEIKKYNHNTKTEVDSWISKHSPEKVSFFAVGPVDLPKKWAGVGLARKSGMDEALRRFNLLEKPNGIIVSLDADTLVAKNYLVEIEKHFSRFPKNIGATISFQHQLKDLGEKQLMGILLYEKYLLYYKNALRFIGYPNPLFTVGSAFAVTADGYLKRGGMTRRQAGEDFYFLQTLAQIGAVGEITNTTVYPSARESDRIPFGTGPAIAKWMNDEADLTQTYNFQAFVDLKLFFDAIENLFRIEKEGFNGIIKVLPEPIRKFIQTDNFWVEIEDLNQNCSTPESFKSRFFHKFNAFKILKFMNFGHDGFYEKANLDEQFIRLQQHEEE